MSGKYDIAEAYGPSQNGARMIARVFEQSRLQAAFCEAYEALTEYVSANVGRGSAESLLEYIKRAKGLRAEIDAAWQALQNHINED